MAVLRRGVHRCRWAALAAIVCGMLAAAPPGRIARAAGPTTRVPVLMYHDFGEVDQDLVCSKEAFAAQVKYLKENGFHAISATALVEALQGRGPLPGKPVVLTFDDGYASHYEFVYPTLKENGMIGVFFVTAEFVGRPGYASWEQLGEMVRAGMEVGSHSFSHPDMRLVPDGPRLVRETQGSRREIETRLSCSVSLFCYPSGRYDAKTIRALRKAGYAGAFTIGNRHADGASGAFALTRLRVRRSDTIEEFAEKLRAQSVPPPTVPACPTAARSGGGKTVFQVLREM